MIRLILILPFLIPCQLHAFAADGVFFIIYDQNKKRDALLRKASQMDP